MSPRRAARIVLGQTFRTRRRYLSEFRQGVGDDEENYLILKEEVQNLLAVYREGGRAATRKKKGRKLPCRCLAPHYSSLCSQPLVVVKAAEHGLSHDFDQAFP